MIRRVSLAVVALALSACSADRLTGVAAENAARQYQAQRIAPRVEPLVFVDGKEVTSEVAWALDPKTIESIEVVKGAAAVTVYGERGGNGVILITRKAASGGAR